MRLLLKFNLIFLLIFAAGLAAISRVSWQLLERNAREEIAQSARLLMDAAIATRSYTSGQVNPLLQTQMKYSFLPQSVPAYSATETRPPAARSMWRGRCASAARRACSAIARSTRRHRR